MAVFSRVMPTSQTEAGREEVQRLIKQVLRIPGFAEEVRPVEDQLGTLLRYKDIAHALPSWNFLRMGGPIVAKAMTVFATKLGMAMHTATTGRIVPGDGTVEVQLISNLQAYEGKLPKEFLDICGPGKTLRQGSFEVADQFRVASAISPDEAFSGHLAVFRNSFAALMIVQEQPDKRTREQDKHWVLSPGFLKRQLNVWPISQP